MIERFPDETLKGARGSLARQEAKLKFVEQFNAVFRRSAETIEATRRMKIEALRARGVWLPRIHALPNLATTPYIVTAFEETEGQRFAHVVKLHAHGYLERQMAAERGIAVPVNDEQRTRRKRIYRPTGITDIATLLNGEAVYVQWQDGGTVETCAGSRYRDGKLDQAFGDLHFVSNIQKELEAARTIPELNPLFNSIFEEQL